MERSRVSRSPDGRKKNGQRYSRKGETSDEGFESSSSSESDGTEEKTVKVHRSKHLLKPPKFDGVKSFETFWAQFRNCAEHNRWTRKEELVYLRNALDKEAANVLWDYGKEVTESLTELTETLKKRFGGKAFADKHRIEIRNRRRRKDETLQSLRVVVDE